MTAASGPRPGSRGITTSSPLEPHRQPSPANAPNYLHGPLPTDRRHEPCRPTHARPDASSDAVARRSPPRRCAQFTVLINEQIRAVLKEPADHHRGDHDNSDCFSGRNPGRAVILDCPFFPGHQGDHLWRDSSTRSAHRKWTTGVARPCPSGHELDRARSHLADRIKRNTSR